MILFGAPKNKPVHRYTTEPLNQIFDDPHLKNACYERISDFVTLRAINLDTNHPEVWRIERSVEWFPTVLVGGPMEGPTSYHSTPVSGTDKKAFLDRVNEYKNNLQLGTSSNSFSVNKNGR